ncbi:hypothetical protein FGO68_gene8454 [Halteria grandinella]|uniref:Uncharacterized protein n=1 Tax=Halteria grandinella TaxID=5974 RepID=A0A8J8SUG2_HALGN|nr:hypothetical protein FGO68_gene8454 [Halteria grandinella]
MRAVGCGDPKSGTSEWFCRSEAAWRQSNPLNLYIISHSRAQKKGIGFLGSAGVKQCLYAARAQVKSSLDIVTAASLRYYDAYSLKIYQNELTGCQQGAVMLATHAI